VKSMGDGVVGVRVSMMVAIALMLMARDGGVALKHYSTRSTTPLYTTTPHRCTPQHSTAAPTMPTTVGTQPHSRAHDATMPLRHPTTPTEGAEEAGEHQHGTAEEGGGAEGDRTVTDPILHVRKVARRHEGLHLGHGN
jgi:hypothetical protein